MGGILSQLQLPWSEQQVSQAKRLSKREHDCQQVSNPDDGLFVESMIAPGSLLEKYEYFEILPLLL